MKYLDPSKIQNCSDGEAQLMPATITLRDLFQIAVKTLVVLALMALAVELWLIFNSHQPMRLGLTSTAEFDTTQFAPRTHSHAAPPNNNVALMESVEDFDAELVEVKSKFASFEQRLADLKKSQKTVDENSLKSAQLVQQAIKISSRASKRVDEFELVLQQQVQIPGTIDFELPILQFTHMYEPDEVFGYKLDTIRAVLNAHPEVQLTAFGYHSSDNPLPPVTNDEIGMNRALEVCKYLKEWEIPNICVAALGGQGKLDRDPESARNRYVKLSTSDGVN